MGRYTEKIGGNYGNVGGLLPQFTALNADAGVRDGIPSGKLRCYNDNVTAIKLSAENCDDVVPTTIKELSISSLTVSIFPNPTKGLLNCKSEKAFSEDAIITIIDIKGGLSKQFNIRKGSTLAVFDLTEFPSGLYFLKLELGYI